MIYSSIDMNIHNIDNIKLHKMIFIYNAINDGWTVKLIDNKFEFIKNKNTIHKNQLYFNDYIKGFINNNLNMESFLIT